MTYCQLGKRASIVTPLTTERKNAYRHKADYLGPMGDAVPAGSLNGPEGAALLSGGRIVARHRIRIKELNKKLGTTALDALHSYSLNCKGISFLFNFKSTGPCLIESVITT